MTATASPSFAGPPPQKPKPRRVVVALVGLAVLAAAGLGIGLAVAADRGSPPSPGDATGYSYYQSVMGTFRGASMMGGSGSSSMMGPSGYRWMMGGKGAPGWMRGGSLPDYMMGSGTDPGRVMGSLFADAPGPRISAAQATRLGDEAPRDSTVDRAANRISFTNHTVHLVVLASPLMPAENFRIAAMVNPTIVVPAGATVSIELVNADDDMAHGLAVTANGSASSWMPMMAAAPAFPGAAVWFLGDPTAAGMHTGTLTFTAAAAGTYQYLCPLPGHAQEGMVGNFVVAPGS